MPWYHPVNLLCNPLQSLYIFPPQLMPTCWGFLSLCIFMFIFYIENLCSSLCPYKCPFVWCWGKNSYWSQHPEKELGFLESFDICSVWRSVLTHNVINSFYSGMLPVTPALLGVGRYNLEQTNRRTLIKIVKDAF